MMIESISHVAISLTVATASCAAHIGYSASRFLIAGIKPFSMCRMASLPMPSQTRGSLLADDAKNLACHLRALRAHPRLSRLRLDGRNPQRLQPCELLRHHHGVAL